MKELIQRKRLIRGLLFIVLLVYVIKNVAFLMEPKYSYSKYYDFYQEEEEIDVLFLGTSHAINGIHPMELWKNYGIVSYNLSNYSETICINYWQLVNALRYTKPKLVVIDLYAIGWQEKAGSSHLHRFTDAMPFSMTKVKAIYDLLPPGERAEYFFEFSLYHSRWDELTEEDFKPQVSCEKGAELRTGREYLAAPEMIPQEQYKECKTSNAEYLQKIIDLCKESNIEILLTQIPFAAAIPEQLEDANYGYVVAEKNGIQYLNLFYEKDLINYATDHCDPEHLNISGARKVTDCIGKYVLENYDIRDRRQDKRYAHWNEDLLDYERYKLESMEKETDLYKYMQLVADRNMKVKVYISQESLICNDYLVTSMLDNLDNLGILSYEIQRDAYQTGDIIFGVTDAQTDMAMNYKHFIRKDANVYEMKKED